MALIKCSECGKEISDKAEACPACGNPLQAQKIQKPVVIEQTSKNWKAIQLVSGILIVVGLFYLMIGHSEVTLRGIGTILLLLGIAGSIIGKMGAWWNNR